MSRFDYIDSVSIRMPKASYKRLLATAEEYKQLQLKLFNTRMSEDEYRLISEIYERNLRHLSTEIYSLLCFSEITEIPIIDKFYSEVEDD